MSTFFLRAKLQWSRKNGKRRKKIEKMKTPVYDGDEGKISPPCPTGDSTATIPPLSENAAFSRVILPDTLRDCLCTCVCLWSHVLGTWGIDVACPKRLLLKRLATHRECWVTSTSIKCLVFSGLRLRQTLKNSCPSSQSPPILVKMNGRQEDSVRRRPFSYLRG